MQNKLPKKLSKSDLAFEKAVSESLKEGLHALRGITAEEYRERCLTEWKSVKEKKGEFKILVDYLMPINHYFNSPDYDYMDPQVERSLSGLKREDRIECVSIVLRDEYGQKKETIETPLKPSESQYYAIGFFDVLGFKDLIETEALESIYEKYEALLNEEIELKELKTAVMTGPFFSIGSLKHDYAYFSDTIILWTPLIQNSARPFIFRCAHLIAKALRIGLPLRGAISLGEAILDKKRMILLGKPVIEAHNLEAAQEWIGAAFCPSAFWEKWIGEMSPYDVMPYPAPLKREETRDELCSPLVIDWTRHFTFENPEKFLKKTIKQLQKDPEKWKIINAKYENTLKFITAAKKWRKTVTEKRLRGFNVSSSPETTDINSSSKFYGGFIVRQEKTYAGIDQNIGPALDGLSKDALNLLWIASHFGIGSVIPFGIFQWCYYTRFLKSDKNITDADIQTSIDQLCELRLLTSSENYKDTFVTGYICSARASAILQHTPPAGAPQKNEVIRKYVEYFLFNIEKKLYKRSVQERRELSLVTTIAIFYISELGEAMGIGHIMEALYYERSIRMHKLNLKRLRNAKPMEERDKWWFKVFEALISEKLKNYDEAFSLYQEGFLAAQKAHSCDAFEIAKIAVRCYNKMA